ncbi:response regulator transcription factor [Amycolatopsis mongoliensis]|uniref:Response regulator transcription factor n=1 Tax=Amycolatopsis mongoliensis TaxID=715475 RepID=A0A9Y2NHZ3_9PSEU|nr:response regulator transcription factor [Amycolatopsis sp. 4-36]WIX98664.1 response regulator transcription factor [Amycolatopsis sp. 4-36]
MSSRVLVAEDDPKQAQVIRLYLEGDGHTVEVVHDGPAALAHARERRPDLLVLDVMLPGMDGLDVCRTLRTESDLPVLVLTARDSEYDLLRSLDLGADDHMTKPYSPRELLARTRTLLRRARFGPQNGPLLRVGDLVVDPERHAVHLEGRPAECTHAEFALLEVFAGQPDRAFTRERLLELTRGTDAYVTTRTIDVHVLNLRRKIERDPSRPARLVTVYGVGYKLTDAG